MERSNDQSWHWQAIDKSLNVSREYYLHITTDLFGWTIVERCWGRIGTKGQKQVAAFASRAEALKLAQNTRKRRLTASRRIGVTYNEVAGNYTDVTSATQKLAPNLPNASSTDPKSPTAFT